jgi:hypothetical protein
MRISNCLLPVGLVVLASLIGCGGGTNTSINNGGNNPSLTAIMVAPSSAGLNMGATQQFTATGQYQDGSTKDLTTTAQWNSSASSVVTINSAGLAKAIAPGAATVTATTGGKSGSTKMTVTAGLVSISVTPVGPGITVGNAEQFTATGHYQDGSTKDLTLNAMWSSSTSAATISSSGVALGVAAGFSTITASVDSIAGSTALTITAAAPSPVAFSGNFAFTITGADSRGPQFYAGVLHADGNGNLSGVEDANTAAGVFENVSLSGTYNLFADGRGNMTLNAPGLPSHDYRFMLLLNGTIGKMIEFDALGNAMGSFEKQDSTALSTSAVSGNYVFGFEGIESDGKIIAETGLFTADGSGAITGGTQDSNMAGVHSVASPTGTYAVAANGRGTATLNTSSGSANFAFYVVSSNKLNFVEVDPGATNVLAGPAEKQANQAFSTSSLSAGGYVLSLGHAPGLNRGVFDKLGQLALDGNGNITSGIQDEDTGNLLNNVTGGTYTVAANGRGTLEETTDLGTRDFFIYMVSPSKMYVLEVRTSAAVGTAEAQSPGSGFSVASLSGTYGFTGSEIGESQTGISVKMVGDGAGNMSGAGDLSVQGAQSAVILNGTATVAPNGRVTITLANPVGAQELVLYLISSSRAVVLGVDPDLNGTLELQ